MLETLKYGSITLVIQDGKIVQIDKNEAIRNFEWKTPSFNNLQG